MKKEKEIFVCAIFKDFISLRYEAYVFAGQAPENLEVSNVWFKIPTKKGFAFNFPSVRQAKKCIRQVFGDEPSPEYACIIVDGEIKGHWWTHTKKHIETMTVSQFKRELWVNSGVVADELFKELWRD